ncbi:MAG: hypothetical protein EP298_10370 [Gammaproteobacteria bacterium]|nr:MAG: hypothetical protein EP298_10370 [Gammaproteobacteria bacterium]UTW42178.1 hypothetical protein KFE69_11890 [bacterium SCSIO 12844]
MELLIAMSLGGIVIAFAIRDYSLSSYQYNQEVKSLTITTNQLAALDLITKSIDNAGLAGLSNLNASRFKAVIHSSNPAIDRPVIYVLSKTSKQIIANLGLNKKGSGQYTNDSDVLVINSTSNLFYTTFSNLLKGNDVLHLPKYLKLKLSDTLVIATVNRFYYFDIKAIENDRNQMQRVYLTNPLADTIPKNSIVSKLNETIFYIGKSNQKDAQNQKINSLYVKLNNRRYEVMPNIDSLKIVGLVEQEGHIINKKPATITNWHHLKGLKLQLGSKTHLIDRVIAVQRYQA